jgi:hypothetical protein
MWAIILALNNILEEGLAICGQNSCPNALRISGVGGIGRCSGGIEGVDKLIECQRKDVWQTGIVLTSVMGACASKVTT